MGARAGSELAGRHRTEVAALALVGPASEPICLPAEHRRARDKLLMYRQAADI